MRINIYGSRGACWIIWLPTPRACKWPKIRRALFEFQLYLDASSLVRIYIYIHFHCGKYIDEFFTISRDIWVSSQHRLFNKHILSSNKVNNDFHFALLLHTLDSCIFNRAVRGCLSSRRAIGHIRSTGVKSS